MKRSEELRDRAYRYTPKDFPTLYSNLLIASELAALREAIEERFPKIGEQPKLEGFHRGNS